MYQIGSILFKHFSFPLESKLLFWRGKGGRISNAFVRDSEVKMVIVIGGMIGLGKTTTAKMLSERLSLPVYYESVEGNKVLPLFYKASPEEKAKNRYPFLLQLSFLSNRFGSIRKALLEDNAILDRSIYEDRYFASRNHDLGNISDLEMEIYDGLLGNLMADLLALPKKAPDVMVYLKGSFDTVLERIGKRGRSFELGDELVSYYHFLWEGYDDWVFSSYKASPLIVVDVDKVDILHNPSDFDLLVEQIKKAAEKKA